MTVSLSAYSRYLPVEPDALDWGVHVLDGGFTEIPPGLPYPPFDHPEAYMFTWERGRTLTEYQIVYITRGAGLFESASAGTLPIAAGQVFCLFPGEWHRYRPAPEEGWDENWIGFSGDHARRLMSRFFSPLRPVLHAGHDEALVSLIREVADLLDAPGPGYQQIVAAKTVEALARIRSLDMARTRRRDPHGERIRRARCHLLEHADHDVDLEALARELGMSYSRFRARFRDATGLPPKQYHLAIRINKARLLLLETDLTVSEIASRLGFSSVHYFSRVFRQKMGLPPSHLRAGGPRAATDPRHENLPRA